jgi:hypothetical protein
MKHSRMVIREIRGVILKANVGTRNNILALHCGDLSSVPSVVHCCVLHLQGIFFFGTTKGRNMINWSCDKFNCKQPVEYTCFRESHWSLAIPLKAWIGPEGSRRFRLPEFQDNRHMKMTRLSALHTSRLYPPRRYHWYSFLLHAESTPGPSQWKILMIPSGIEPATFRLVTQCLNHRTPTAA